MDQLTQYIFPAVFYEENDEVTVVFPDLNIFTEGKSFEDAFLFAKDYLRVYCTYALKYDIELDVPSKFEKIVTRFKPATAMLVDAILGPKDLK